MALGACGDDRPEGATPTATGDDGGGFPVEIEHQYGTTVVPARPERIACVDVYETDVVLALGLAPITMNYYEGFEEGIADWQRPFLPDPPPPRFRYVDGYNVEATVATRPDLIRGSYVSDTEYDLFSAAAPTIVFSYDLPVEERVPAVGRAVGLVDEAAAVLEGYQATLAAAAEAAGLGGLTVAAVAHDEFGVLTNLNDEESFGLLAQLGAVSSPALAELEPYADLGMEGVEQIDADLVLVVYGNEADQADFEANQLFNSVPAIAAGRYLPILSDGELDLTRARGVLQVPYVLERFVPAVQALPLP